LVKESLLSAGDALKYLEHHGEKMSQSNLRQLSASGVVESSTTSGGHNRYSIDALQGYLSGFEHKVFYIAASEHAEGIVVNPAQLSIMKTDRNYPLHLKSKTLPSLVVEIHNRLIDERGSNSLFISYCPELLDSPYFQLLASLLSEIKTTLIVCSN
jgi:hypothetical protein